MRKTNASEPPFKHRKRTRRHQKLSCDLIAIDIDLRKIRDKPLRVTFYRDTASREQLEFGLLIDRKVAWRRTLENLVDVAGHATEGIHDGRPIGHEPSDLEVLATRK